MKKYFVLLIGLVFFACNKDQEFDQTTSENKLNDISSIIRSSLPSPFDILELVSAPVSGYAYLTTFSTLSSQDHRDKSVLAGGYFVNDAGQSSDHGLLSFNNTVQIRPNPRNNYHYQLMGHPGAAGLFSGRPIGVTLSGNGGAPGFSSRFHVPPMIDITAPAYANDLVLYDGLKMAWTPDAANSNGVVLLVYYDQGSPDNRGLRAPSVKNPIHTDDDGSYTFTANDLSGIPSGARVNVYIGRANYKRVPMQEGGDHVGLATYSVLSSNFTKR